MKNRIGFLLLSFSLGALVFNAGAEAPWRFISLPDWHSAEKYVSVWESAWSGAGFDSYAAYRADRQAGDTALMANIQASFGGELLIMPGDTQGGHWDATSFQNNFKSVPEYSSYTTAEVISEAGHFCYSGMREAFVEAGYSNILCAIGDHEVGDNDWGVNATVSKQLPAFRSGFADIMNRDDGGAYIHTNLIGTAAARPVGTVFEGTSYAVQHKNVLFVTVDIFYQQSPSVSIGTTGTVIGKMEGDHLAWFTNVLEQASSIPSIKHMVVQSHLPGIYPVRKYASSGMLLVDNENSDFFNAMRQYGVDIYMAGEVHENTVTQDPDSDLIQLVTRGNSGSNPTIFDISDDRIYIETYKGQTNTTRLGTLEIDKSGAETLIAGTGVLEPIDPDGLQFHFAFDQSVDEDDVVTPANNSRKVNTLCGRAFENDGGFGVAYTAFANNCPIDPQGVIGGAATFGSSTEVGITAMGPFMEDYERAVACWVKTTSDQRQIILDTTSQWNTSQFFNISLNDGHLEVILKSGSVKRSNESAVNDGNWHHIAVVVPWRSANLSAVKLYVDGIEQTNVTTTGGTTSVWTIQSNWPTFGTVWSRSKLNLKSLFGMVDFTGSLDELCVWTRGLSATEIKAVVDGAENRGFDGVYMEALFNLYNAGAGTAEVEGVTWTVDPTLIGPEGVFLQSGATNLLVLGNQGGVMTVDTDPPTPNPAEFLVSPAAVSPVQVEMTAVAGSDASGLVEYLFSEVSGNYGGTDSGWQSSSAYVDDGLLPDTTYAYTVTTRDVLGHVGSAGSVAEVTTPSVVFPQGAIAVAWHTPGTTAEGSGVNDSSPDLVLDGVSASLSGGRDGWASFNSTDFTYGSLAVPFVPDTAANAIRVRTFSAAESRVDLALANNTGGDLVLDSFHFDFGGFDAGPMDVELIYLSGDLVDADNTSIASASRPTGSSAAADYHDVDLSLSPSLSDVVLASGESMVLRLQFSNASGTSSASGIDNIALLCAVGNVDSDGDGIPDAVEQLHQPILDPNNPADALLDEDDDGFSNGAEILSATDLSSSSNYFQIALSTNSGFSVEIPKVAEGRVYALEFCPELGGDWIAVDALFAEPSHDELPYAFYPVVSESNGFYRVRVMFAP